VTLILLIAGFFVSGCLTIEDTRRASTPIDGTAGWIEHPLGFTPIHSVKIGERVGQQPHVNGRFYGG